MPDSPESDMGFGELRLCHPVPKPYRLLQVSYEDDGLLVIDKEPGLPVRSSSQQRQSQQSPTSLYDWLLDGIQAGAGWAVRRQLEFLRPAHAPDADISGLTVWVKRKEWLGPVRDQLNEEKAHVFRQVLVHGSVAPDEFELEDPLAEDPRRDGCWIVDLERGKKAITKLRVLERFHGFTLLEAAMVTDRPHQLRVQLSCAGNPVVGDRAYRGRRLFLSGIKPDYRPRKAQQKPERALLARPAIHGQRLEIRHPAQDRDLVVESEGVKDLKVALRYLREYCPL